MELIDVRDGICSIVMMFKFKIKQKGIILDKIFLEELLQVKVFVSEFNQVWINLIVNVVDVMDKGGEFKIKVYYERIFVCVEIIDNGYGILEEIQICIFEFFFIIKLMDEGIGMGLDIV